MLRRPTPRPRREPSPEFRRQHGLWRSRRTTLGDISFSKRRTHRIFRFIRTSTGNVSPSLPKRPNRLRTAIRVQDISSSTQGLRPLWTLHFVKYRYRNFTLEYIVNEFSAQDPKTIEAELKDIYEWICVQHIVNKKNWIIIFVIVHSIFHISNVRSFNTYLFVSDRIFPAATVRTIEWMGYLRSVIKATHWVSSILNIGKKMKHLSLFCLYRLLKRKHGDIYRFNTLIRQFYRFDFPQRCSFLIRWNSIQPIDPLVQTI